MARSRIARSLGYGTIVSGMLVSTLSTAAPTLSLDTTTVGEQSPYYGYSGFYRKNSDYALLTNGQNTYINAASGGTIFFRGGNGGGSFGAVDPDGWYSRMFLDSDNNLVVGGTVKPLQGVDIVTGTVALHALSTSRVAIDAETSSDNTLPAIRGRATNSGGYGIGVSGYSVNGDGVEGQSDNGIGVYGSGAAWGVYGYSPNGVAVRGDSAGGGVEGNSYGATGAGVRGTNSAGGLAGDFSGKVQIGTGPLVPAATNTVSIGTSALRFSNIYLINQPVVGSDIRLKKDVKDSTFGLSDVLKLRPVTYRWNSGSDDSRQLGLIAQEVEKVIPDVVVHGTAPSDPLSMRYEALVPVLIKAVQEQQARIDFLERKQTVASTPFPSGALGIGLALGLLPLGMTLRLRKRKADEIGETH